ncbi:MAG: PIG-L deacetylase family protein [Armatimonadota bacterium]
MNILAIGAHPDDVELMCGGTLLKYKQQGHSIYIALTTSGNIGSNTHGSREEIARIREGEQLDAAKITDAQVRFLQFDDELLVDTPATRRAVLNALRWAKPDVIFTHAPFDPSPDHAMTSALVSKVLLSMPSKLIPADEPPVDKKISIFYWDIVAGINFLPETYVDISDMVEQKLDAMRRHRSQVDWMANFADEDLADYASVLSRLRGMQIGCKHAEAFRGHRIHGFMPDFKLLP